MIAAEIWSRSRLNSAIIIFRSIPPGYRNEESGVLRPALTRLGRERLPSSLRVEPCSAIVVGSIASRRHGSAPTLLRKLAAYPRQNALAKVLRDKRCSRSIGLPIWSYAG
jgi:hypothetical protein